MNNRFIVLLAIVVAGVSVLIPLWSVVANSEDFSVGDTTSGPTAIDSTFQEKTTHFLGAYYMPKPTGLTHQWRSLIRYNRTAEGKEMYTRKPLLGFHAGDNADAMDWQIKFAVEHGISYWVFDDYWTYSQATPVYASSMNGYLNSRFQRKLKFAAMITDLSIPNDSRNLTRQKMLGDIAIRYRDLYFKKSNYLRLDGKPVVYIYSLGVFGRGAVDNAWIKGLLTAFEQKVGTEVYWIFATAGGSEPSYQRYKDMGFDALSPYYVLPDSILNGEHPTYKEFTLQQRNLQTTMLKKSQAAGLKFITSITSTFDERNRPLDAPHITNPRYVSTPADINLYMQMQNAMADELAQYPGVTVKRGGKVLTGLGAYNEWIEGAMIEAGTGNVKPDGHFAQLYAIASKFIPGNTVAAMAYNFSVIPDFSMVTPSITSWDFGDPVISRLVFNLPNSGDVQPNITQGYGEFVIEEGTAVMDIPANVLGLENYSGLKFSYASECPTGDCLASIAVNWFTTSCEDDKTTECGTGAAQANAIGTQFINPSLTTHCATNVRGGVSWKDCTVVPSGLASTTKWQNRLEQLEFVFFTKDTPIKMKIDGVELF